MKEKIKGKLKQLHYSEHSAERAAKDLTKIEHDDIKVAIQEWLKTGRESCVREGKYSTENLTSVYKMEFPAALIFIDWYREEPMIAEKALLMRM